MYRFFAREKAQERAAAEAREPRYGYGLVNGRYVPLEAAHIKRENARRKAWARRHGSMPAPVKAAQPLL